MTQRKGLGGSLVGCGHASPLLGPPLLTGRLRLRPFTPTDAPGLSRITDDEQVVRLTAALPFPFGEDHAQSFIANSHAIMADGKSLVLAMERVVDGTLIGCVGARVEAGMRAELGFWTGSDYWNAGYTTEALLRLIRHLFQSTGVTAVDAVIHTANKASRRVAEKLGLRQSGRRDVEMIGRADNASMLVMSQTRAAWAKTHTQRPKLLVAAAALIDGDGRVLMTTRPPPKSMAGLWEFPGGKVEPGETPEQALKRELTEELGIETGDGCMAPLAFASHDYDTFHLIMPLFAIRVWNGTPEPREGQSLRWVRARDMATLPMPPADIPLVTLLRDWI